MAGVAVDLPVDQLYRSAQQAIDMAQWNEARLWLQKIAYGMVRPNVPAQEKARFTAFMTAFAQQDPMYAVVMAKLRPLLAEQPGLKQSEITGGLDHHDAEQFRYVTYFAEQLGDLVRVKSGSSYKLYLPGQPLAGVAPKAAVAVNLTITVGPVTVHTSPAMEEVRLLGLEATRLKSADINAAIECLRKAQTICRSERLGGQTLDWWMRFPKYLQKAGRHEEARQAYAQLFAEVDDRWEWRTGEHSRKIPFIEQERAALKAILLGLKSRGG